MPYTVASLFSGIGGFDVAFAKTGWDVTAQVEIDPFCRGVLKKHAPKYWPNAKVFSDVRKVSGKQLGSVTALVGGFPCQDISQAGKKEGINPKTRSGLWSEFRRLISEVRPRLALLENVSNITNIGGVQVTTDLARIGYGCRWLPIFAYDVGSPQSRKRWFAVAYPYTDGHTTTPRSRRDAQELHNITQGEVDPLQSEGSGFPPPIPRKLMAYPTTAGDIGGQRLKENVDGRDSKGSRPGRALSNGGVELIPDENPLRYALSPESIMGRAIDGLRSGLDGYRWVAGLGEDQHPWEPARITRWELDPFWAQRIAALGNAVLPQIVYPIAVAMREWLELVDKED